MRPLALSMLLAMSACSANASNVAHTSSAEPKVMPTSNAAALEATAVVGWAAVTRTPSVGAKDAERDPREHAVASACGAEDAALARVARAVAALRAQGLETPDADAIVARLRMEGDPNVRPRLFVASGHAPIDTAKLHAELAPRTSGASGASPPRCGIAIAPLEGGAEVLVALRVDTVADLAPLPTRARTGEWLTLEARLHVPARSARLVVLGPHGAPRTVPTSLDPGTGIARARFALDEPGAFTVQLLADVAEGPRPLLEARVFADVTPTPLGEEPAAPGEDASPTNDAAALARMVGALRAGEGLSPLRRDERLDALALAHAARMRDGHTVAHDLGDGDFLARFEADGSLEARAVGENVAHAPTVALAHRALHASPSHRINLLRGDYTHLGVAVTRASDGSVYVCETFLSQATRQTAQ